MTTDNLTPEDKMNEHNDIKAGDRIQWTYRHHLNSRSSVMITKSGVFKEVSGKLKNKRYVSGSVAVVHFDGNKHPSRVPYSEISRETKTTK